MGLLQVFPRPICTELRSAEPELSQLTVEIWLSEIQSTTTSRDASLTQLAHWSGKVCDRPEHRRNAVVDKCARIPIETWENLC